MVVGWWRHSTVARSTHFGLAAWLATIEGVRLATGKSIYRRVFDLALIKAMARMIFFQTLTES
jgi:hypothetical protein